MHHTLRLLTITAVASLFLSLAHSARAQGSWVDLKKEIDEIKNDQQAIRKDVMDIKALLTRGAPPSSAPINVKGVKIDLGNSPIMGNTAAQLIVIELTDYQ